MSAAGTPLHPGRGASSATIEHGHATDWALAIVTAVGLALDAYVHIHLAPDFKHVATSTLSQADLFYVEAVLAIVAALAVLAHRRRYTIALAFLVAAGGLVAVVLYRYADIPAIGPIPAMYDPYWAPAEKAISAIAEAVAAATALTLWLRHQPTKSTTD